MSSQQAGLARGCEEGILYMPDESLLGCNSASSSCLYLTSGLVSSQDGSWLGGARRASINARRGTSSGSISYPRRASI